MDYLRVELSGAVLPNGKPCMALYVGTFTLSDRGQVLEVSEQTLEEIVSNFEDLGESGRIPISVNHRTGAGTLEEARAVGWVVRLFKKNEGGKICLYMEPRWLDDARQAIELEAFKFLSVGMILRDTNTTTGEPIGAHIREISLTNVPSIPNLAPIELSQKTGLRHKLAELRHRINRLSTKGKTMSGDPVEQFWKLTDQLLAADPKLNPSQARAQVIAQRPDLSLAAQVPGARRGRKGSTKIENSSHYRDKFFALAAEIERQEHCSDIVARGKVLREYPGLRDAAFGTDAKTRFFGAARFETTANKLDLAQAYRAASLHLKADAEVAL